MAESSYLYAGGEVLTAEQDDKLIAEAREGNQRAFWSLVNRHQKTVYHVAHKIVRNDETAEDITQETFMKAFSALASYRSEFRFSTWLCKIAANTSIDHLRKKRIKALSLDREIETSEGTVEFEVPDYSFHPEREFEAKQKQISIDQAINQLSDRYRQVIVYRHRDDKSYEEIADLLNVPVGTVKARIFRARELLKKSLKGIR